MNEQAERNRKEFEDMEDDVRVQYEGFRAGMYVRLEVNVSRLRSMYWQLCVLGFTL